MKPPKQTSIRMSKPDECAACPMEVRNLYATAHNALNAFDAAKAGHGDWSRCHRKMEELRDGLEKMRPLVDAHFADRGHAKIFRVS